jgi:hypothetical protein
MIRLEARTGKIAEWVRDLGPGKPMVEEAAVPADAAEAEIGLVIETCDGREVIGYAPLPKQEGQAPAPASEPLAPEHIESTEELYLTGLHLDQ